MIYLLPSVVMRSSLYELNFTFGSLIGSFKIDNYWIFYIYYVLNNILNNLLVFYTIFHVLRM
jgi:hypothetical protein